MFDWVGDALAELWRNMMFDIIDFGLSLTSTFVSDIIIPASKLSFLKSTIVMDGYAAFVTIALSLLVVCILFAFVGSMIKGDLDKRIKQIIIGGLCSVILMVVTQPLVLWAYEGVSEAAMLVTTDDKLTSLDDAVMKTAISASNPTMSSDDATNFVIAYREADFDYNAKDDDDNYIYTLNPFPTLLISFVVLFLLLFVAFQIVLRSITVAFLLCIAPFSTISLISESPQGARFVFQQISNTLFMTAVQMWILLFSLSFIGDMTTTNMILKLIILCVGLLFVLQAPNIIAGITGGQQGSLLQTAQSALMGANAGRALAAGAIGSVMATGNGVLQTVKGAFAGKGKGVMGSLGNMASAPVRFTGGMLKGNGKTVMNNEGTKANQMGAQMRQKFSNGLQKNNLKSTGSDSPLKSGGAKGSSSSNDGGYESSNTKNDTLKPKGSESRPNSNDLQTKTGKSDSKTANTSGRSQNIKSKRSGPQDSQSASPKRTVSSKRSANHRLKSSNRKDTNS